jgi:hypothetical protein
MKKVIQSLCAVVLLMPLEVGYAFWSDPYYGTHQDITSAALSGPDPSTGQAPFCFSAGQCFSFSPNAITQINKRHLKQDTPLFVAYDPNDHFDSNSFSGSLTKMAINRGALKPLLSGGNLSAATQTQVWALVGNMLHAVEDFYAHSTWVDEGNSNIIGFGAATENTAQPNITIFPVSPLTVFCDSSNGYPLSVLPVSYLITGYYPPAMLPTGGCVHGATLPTLYSIITSQLTPSLIGLCDYLGSAPQTVPGISHDVACSGNFLPNNTMQLHQSAYDLAVQEARSFVQAIVADLSSAGNGAGFCLLLGLDQNQAPCLSDCALKAEQNIQIQYSSIFNANPKALSLTVTLSLSGNTPFAMYGDAGYIGYANLFSMPSESGAPLTDDYILDVSISPTPYSVGTFQGVGEVAENIYALPGTALYFPTALVAPVPQYALASPNQIQITAFSNVCRDAVANTELDTYSGSISAGLVTEGLPSGTGSLSGTFSGNEYICKAGTTPTASTAGEFTLHCN